MSQVNAKWSPYVILFNFPTSYVEGVISPSWPLIPLRLEEPQIVPKVHVLHSPNCGSLFHNNAIIGDFNFFFVIFLFSEFSTMKPGSLKMKAKQLKQSGRLCEILDQLHAPEPECGSPPEWPYTADGCSGERWWRTVLGTAWHPGAILVPSMFPTE